jgi:uncharacterized membrane protein
MERRDIGDSTARKQRLIWAGLLIGIGLGGFFDGIVLHQILQWHHMLTSEGSYPPTTVDGLKTNTLWDGLFHAFTFIATTIGLWLLWKAAREPHAPWSTKLLIGLILMGWGTFNLVEGTVDHHILTIHHVRENSANRGLWDIAFLVWGALMLLGGWRLAKAGEAEQDAHEERATVVAPPRSAAPRVS